MSGRESNPAPGSPRSSAPPARKSGASSDKTLDLARSFLSALFMGLRTAQVHAPTNAAFQTAIDTVRRAAEELYANTSGFTIQFVEGSAFVNGSMMRFDSSTYQTVRRLRELLESKGLGGIGMQAPPNEAHIRKLVLLFTPDGRGKEVATKEELEAASIGLLGIQRYSDGKQTLQVDRRLFALQSYAKLVLALREQVRRLTDEQQGSSSGPSSPRVRAVRVVQDLVELCHDRFDFLLKLSLNRSGATADELLGANTCMLALALGHAAGFERQDLVSIGVAALFHDIGRSRSEDRALIDPVPKAPSLSADELASLEPIPPAHSIERARTAFATVIAHGDLGSAGITRAVIVGEQARMAARQFAWGTFRPYPHPASRVVTVALSFVSELLGLSSSDEPPLHPLDLLARMSRDETGGLDPDLVDLLINVFRAFPIGTEVILGSGKKALVREYTLRWDRPIVAVFGDESAAPLDLSVKEGERFDDRIVSTLNFAGIAPLGDRERESLLPHADDDASRVHRGASILPGDLDIERLEDRLERPWDATNNETPLQLDLESTIPPLEQADGGFDTEDLAAVGVGDPEEDQLLLESTFDAEIEQLPDLSDFVQELLEADTTAAHDDAPVVSEEMLESSPPTEVDEAPVASVLTNIRTILGYTVTRAREKRGARYVYEGIDPDDESEVLIHTWNPDRVNEGSLARLEAVELFEREARLAAQISHPALPRLLDAARIGERRVMVYEQSPGTSLAAILASGHRPKTREVRAIARSIAEALHHLHEHGIVHCGVGTRSIAIAAGGNARFTDLSLATFVSEPPHPRIMERAPILSPEFRRGAPYGPRSDQYALGAVLYELLTGRFPGPILDDPHERLRPPALVDPRVDGQLSAVAMRLLEPAPMQRFESCEALALYLSRAASLSRRAHLRPAEGSEGP